MLIKIPTEVFIKKQEGKPRLVLGYVENLIVGGDDWVEIQRTMKFQRWENIGEL